MARSVMNILTQTSRRLISKIIVNVGDTICCKRWKNKINRCLPQVDEIEKVLDCQDENEKATDSFTPESVAAVLIADGTLRKPTTEPDWMKSFYKVDDAEEIHDEIFQSDDEDDEDCLLYTSPSPRDS